MPPSEFWTATPREVAVILEARHEADFRSMRERQGLTYTLAVLMGAALNNPKKFPKFAQVFPDPRKPERVQTPEEMLLAMRAWSDAVDIAMRH